MPTFEYQATGTDGAVVRGVVFGPSQDQALQDLQKRGMTVTYIADAMRHTDPIPQDFGDVKAAVIGPREEIPSGYVYDMPDPVQLPSTEEMLQSDDPLLRQRSYVATSVWGPLVGKVDLKQLGLFFRQFSTMLNAAVPMTQILDTLGTHSRSPKLKKIVFELRELAKSGRPISAGLQRYPEVFSPVMVSLIRAGEEGGFLDAALATVADYIEKEVALRNLYKRITFYPKLQLVASILIILAANAIIHALGKESSLSSPLTEKATWIFLTPIIVGLFLFFRVGLANPRIKYNWDLITIHIPYLGNTIKQLSMAKFGRAFGALYKGGVSVPKAMQLAADACGNEYLRSKINPAARELHAGEGIAKTFRGTEAFSPIVLDMVSTGETTGNLDQMLNKLAEFYEDEGATRSHQTAVATGVFIGLIVAAYIGYVVVTFWMKQYAGLSQQLNGAG